MFIWIIYCCSLNLNSTEPSILCLDNSDEIKSLQNLFARCQAGSGCSGSWAAPTCSHDGFPDRKSWSCSHAWLQDGGNDKCFVRMSSPAPKSLNHTFRKVHCNLQLHFLQGSTTVTHTLPTSIPIIMDHGSLCPNKKWFIQPRFHNSSSNR